MTLKSAFKAIGTDITEPCSRTAFDHFTVHGRSPNPKIPNGSSIILPQSGCDRMRRDGHNRKVALLAGMVPFNSPEAIVIQGVLGRRDSTVIACSPASPTNHFREAPPRT